MQGTRVSVDIGGGRLVSGRLRGRGPSGEYIVISDRTGGTHYTRRLLMSHEEAARFLATDQPVIRKLIRDGKLTVVHVGRSIRLTAADFEEVARLVAAGISVPKRRKRRRKRAKAVAKVPVKAVGAKPARKAKPAKRQVEKAAAAKPAARVKAVAAKAAPAAKPAAKAAPKPRRKAGAKAKSRKAVGAR